MKKLKIVIISMILLLLCGCSATYELTINDDEIIEKMSLIEEDFNLFDMKKSNGTTIREDFESLLNDEDVYSKSKYVIKSLNTDDRLGIEYTSSKLKSISNLSMLNQCYSNFKFEENNEIVNIETGYDFRCYKYYENLDKIKVVFKTNHKVISTNATQKQGNTYIWEFDEYSNKNIKISYYKNKTVGNSKGTIIIILSLLFIVGVVSLLVIKKKNKNNKV